MLFDDLHSFNFYGWIQPFLSGRDSLLSILPAHITVYLFGGLNTIFYLDLERVNSEMIRNFGLQVPCVIYLDQEKSCYRQL